MANVQLGVCFFCHDGNGKYLLGKRSQSARNEGGVWSPGAGGLEDDEHVEEGLHREMMEEYGTKPLDIEFLGFRDFIYASSDHWVMFDYRVKVDPLEVRNAEPDKCDGLMWATYAEIEKMDEPFHSQWEVFREKYKDKFI